VAEVAERADAVLEAAESVAAMTAAVGDLGAKEAEVHHDDVLWSLDPILSARARHAIRSSRSTRRISSSTISSSRGSRTHMNRL
jgi:hypothetical protein